MSTSNVSEVVKKSGVSLNILGNKKGLLWIADNCPANYNDAQRRAFAAQNHANGETQEARKEEALKLVPFFVGTAQPQIKKQDLIDYMESQKLKLSLATLNKLLKGTAAEATARAKRTESVNAFEPVESDTDVKNLQRVHDDEVVIKKSQVTFFEILWSLATEAQRAEVKKRVADAAREAVLAQAEAAAAKAADDIAAMFPSQNATQSA